MRIEHSVVPQSYPVKFSYSELRKRNDKDPHQLISKDVVPCDMGGQLDFPQNSIYINTSAHLFLWMIQALIRYKELLTLL